MVFLIMIIIAHTAVMLAMRFTEICNGNRYAATLFNFIVCAIISFFFIEDKTLFFTTKDGWFTVGFALFNSFFMTGGMIFTRMSMKANGTPISTTFNRLGVLIPTILSILLFHEMPSPIQVIGIGIAVTSIIYVNSGHANKDANHIHSIKLLILIFVVGGMIDFNTKVFESLGNKALQSHYVFYTFIFCTIVSLVIMLMREKHFTRQDMLIGALTGIPNQLLLYFSMRAVNVLPAYLVFPANSAGIILCVNLINYFVLKEPLSKREKIATVMVAVALVFINI